MGRDALARSGGNRRHSPSFREIGMEHLPVCVGNTRDIAPTGILDIPHASVMPSAGPSICGVRIEARDSLRCTGEALFEARLAAQHGATAKHWFPTRRTHHADTAPTRPPHRPHPRGLPHDRHRAL